MKRIMLSLVMVAAAGGPALAQFIAASNGAGAVPKLAEPGPLRLAQATARLADGAYKGQPADAYYGIVQVQANVSNGQLVSVRILQYPNDRNTSRYINSQALPLLKSEAIQMQTGQVDIISGATLTSEAFIQSLSSALQQAEGGGAGNMS